MQTIYSQKENCCGCTACFSTCPEHAITMEPDEEGFLYPVIDLSRCVDCGKCTAVCPVIYKGHYKSKELPCLYAVRHKSDTVLRRSTSGGAFTAISDTILRLGGVVYGADFDLDFYVQHKRAETAEMRDQMRISKYVQSDMGNTFSQIQSDLKDGRTVLFTGTPCQNAGLKGFIGNSSLSKNLYLCDVICYSIPSPLVWKDYKHFLEKEYGGNITSLQFRSKKYSWSRDNCKKGFLFTIDHNPEILEDNRFYQLFFKAGTINRPSCSQCRFTDIHRTSDLTIADYWGIEKYDPEWFDPLGVSLTLINSLKGMALFQQSLNDLVATERPLEEILYEQKRLSKPLPLPESRSLFWQDYKNFGFDFIMQKYTVK